MLEKAGSWGVLRGRLSIEGRLDEMKKGRVVEPGIGKQDGGLRRSLCEWTWLILACYFHPHSWLILHDLIGDMVLLMFHLVFSTITYNGIDIPFASQILGYNAARYPRGIFFLFGQGRLALFKGGRRSSFI
jgi:hypothetical protein